MHQSLKNAAKITNSARYTWLSIMAMAMLFADQWGVAKPEIIKLLMITMTYGVSIELLKRFLYFKNPWLVVVGFTWDLLAWSLFVYHSGGAANPLITLFLTVIAVASIVMPTKQIIGLSVLSIALYSLLWYFYIPLTLSHHDSAVGAKLHLLGMFGVFIFSAFMLTALTVFYKKAMTRSYQALEQAQQAIHQQRRLLAVSSLAANIAHEMSTPIASMQLLTEGIIQQLDEEDELIDDVMLLQSQIGVCRQSLETLKTHIQSNQNIDIYSSVNQPNASNLQTLLPKVINDWRFINPHLKITLDAPSNPVLVSLNEEQLYSILINLFNNAMQAQASIIGIKLTLTQHAILQIEDNGGGIDPEIIANINHRAIITSTKGWGLGLTMAKTILEYVGGGLEIKNISPAMSCRLDSDMSKQSGTQVIITLPITMSNLHDT